MDYKQHYRNEVMKKKREELAAIKRDFVDSGEAAKMSAILKEKRKPSIRPEDLPF